MDILEELRINEERRHERILRYLGNRRTTSVVEDLKAALPEGRIEVDGSGISFSVAGTKDTLTRAFRIVRRHGFLSENHPEEGSPTFGTFFVDADDKANVGLEWEGKRKFWFYFTSQVCKRVHKGKEWKEVDVWETVCGEDTAQPTGSNQPTADISAQPPPSSLSTTETATEFDNDIPF